jgi:hypothetical protein
MSFAIGVKRNAPAAKAGAIRAAAPARRPGSHFGNQALLRRLSPAPVGVQAKLEIGAVDDPLEREADRVADQVMRMPDPAPAVSAAPLQISRKCAACEEEDRKKLQLKSAGGADLAGAEAPPMVHEVLRGPGRPLDAATRAFFEPRFGYDFGEVRVHANAKAARSAQAVKAIAYTSGSSIVFAAQRYAPHTSAGARLLAHELTHVLQQQGPGAIAFPALGRNQRGDLQRQDDTAQQASSAPEGACKTPYDTTYGPGSSNCSAYQSGLAKRFLTWTYRHNATCACENTPDDPKNNCVRKCLQVKMAGFLSGLSKGGGAIGTCLDSIGLLDFTCPEPYCSDLYQHHVDCYRDCCCEGDFIAYPAFWFMCEAPYPCFFVGLTIRKFNACR